MVEKNTFVEIENDVLSRIVPKKSAFPVVNVFVESLKKTASKIGIDCRVVIGGSVAKDTYLDGDFDCDVFVRFNPQQLGKSHAVTSAVVVDEKIVSYLTQIVKKIAQTSGLAKNEIQLLHGSRDYYKITKDGITYELIPTLDVKNAAEAPNVTDMSLFHVDWVVTACKKNKKLSNEIRLAKAFCKGQGVYGAESYIGGFSGHVIDILVIYCGGFREFLKDSLTWQNKQIIDVENHHAGKDALSILNEAKLTSPIIVIDPIVSQRNAASALNKSCFEKFKLAASAYLKNPSLGFFVNATFDFKSLAKLPGVTYVLHLVPQSDKKDIAGAQHVKVLEYICQQARENDFAVVGSGWVWSADLSGDIYVRFERDKLSETHDLRGPPIAMTDAANKFRAAHLTIEVRTGCLWAAVARKYPTVEKLFTALVAHELIKMRCKSFSWKKID